ncbi:hypothetical protein E8E13_001132 [Curvularia kusanoi]|uniref:Uncharacterized protein n=1 Tax=Curvularia kusanoi TaxID=90978 RepID=A0A9P4TA87_CURKU|nr:hypothetical protein E8E13_001132 [Curvularia kusanoi]
MLKSKWATKTDEEAPTTAPAKQEVTTPAPAPPAVNVSYDATYNDPSMDSFAQTAGTDDLFFDDDITPISQPVVEQSSTLGAEAPEFVPAPEQPTPTSAPQAPQHAPRAPREPRNAERGGRGRGRGRGDIRLEEQAAKEELARDTPAPAEPAAAAAAAAAANEPPADAPTGPSTPSTASVRGDRTLTGGSKRTRLTEAELSAKLASMRSKNEALASAHARAQADAAAAEAREAVIKQQEIERKKLAAEKQKAERKDRQQMMGERERNRQRKLNAQGGREWDLEKEDGFDGTGEERRRGAARGAYGGVSAPRGGAPDSSRELFDDGADSGSYRGGRGRGRGGRGGRGGRAGEFHDNRGHDGRHDARGGSKQQLPPSATDFPELPSSTPAQQSASAPRIQEFKIKGKGENKNEDIRKSEPELRKELEPEPKFKTDEAPVRPEIKKVESFGLEPMKKGQSWADDE